jgi:hypothetical protein
MNDKRLLKSHANGWITNVAVVLIVVLSFTLAILAVPVQILGG